MDCGIDFGTSNSSVVGFRQGTAAPVPLEGQSTAMPTAVFYDLVEHRPYFGREALRRYIEGHDGRLMRSLKSILGSSLIDESTEIGSTRVDYRYVIKDFFKCIKQRAEDHFGEQLTRAVVGRPVHFVDDDPAADQKAQQTLEEVASEVGFTQVAFEYEPVGALRDWLSNGTVGQTILVCDIGGGTADFTLAKCVERDGKPDLDFLENRGVHVGGTDFDKHFSLACFMPQLGLGSLVRASVGTQLLPMPKAPYINLSTWHRINSLYSRQVLREVQDYHRRAAQPAKLAALLNVLQENAGHELLAEIEAYKIALTDQSAFAKQIGCLNLVDELKIERQQLDEALDQVVEPIVETAKECVQAAGLSDQDLSAILMTGGSSQIPLLINKIQAAFPTARLESTDYFGSVATGLALSCPIKLS